VALGALLAGAEGQAQTLVGSVVEEGTRQPLVGAFLRLEDRDGARHGGVLSGPDGRFVLRVPAP
ncbi:MAG: hypothetical protein GWM90_18510, partial [Gemmatimonadetes bacterium]|nr:hypothetical protein [Gemmatimonadota bacterium]NIQ55465.1 hypothetical protein [Gemmatimonadota bacterium]NIU75674.1 hypothetical protein [Gammaproteobacteria bacterium]NIX46012.1 hypothetical protein [Gemmatimonadota bacterium]NIY09634.1 hypothetical protein [Gemmatimonadota bacterium]